MNRVIDKCIYISPWSHSSASHGTRQQSRTFGARRVNAGSRLHLRACAPGGAPDHPDLRRCLAEQGSQDHPVRPTRPTRPAAGAFGQRARGDPGYGPDHLDPQSGPAAAQGPLGSERWSRPAQQGPGNNHAGTGPATTGATALAQDRAGAAPRRGARQYRGVDSASRSGGARSRMTRRLTRWPTIVIFQCVPAVSPAPPPSPPRDPRVSPRHPRGRPRAARDRH